MSSTSRYGGGRQWGDVAYGWIGGTAVTPDRTAAAARPPSLVVGKVTVLLAAADQRTPRPGPATPAPDAGRAGGGGWVRETVVEELDLGADLAAELDLVGRDGEDLPADRWRAG
jgi:hypothetical protein